MKIKALSLALVLLVSVLTLSVGAANEIPSQSPNNTPLPEPWKFVNIDDPDMIQMVNSDGSISDHVTMFAGTNGAIDGDFCYFMGQGHNYGEMSVKLNWVQGAKVTFTFTGTAVAVVSQFHDMIGGSSDIEFILDGESVATLAATDYASPSFDNGEHILQKIYYQKTDLPLGEHTLEVVNAGEKAVCIDGFAYIGDPSVTEPPMTFAPEETYPEETEEPETTSPATNAPHTGDVTEGAETDAPKSEGGCGSAIAAPMMLLAMLSVAFISRKKA